MLWPGRTKAAIKRWQYAWRVKDTTHLEQFGRRVPQLVVGLVRRVASCDFLLELYGVPEFVEVEGLLVRIEDGDFLGEVSIMRVVQRVLNKVAREHLDGARALLAAFEIIASDERVCRGVLWRRIEERIPVVIPFVCGDAGVLYFPFIGRIGSSRGGGVTCLVCTSRDAC